MQAAHLEDLNDTQRAAATFGDDGRPAPPLLVIAGAGSGKTRTLAHRVAHLLTAGADPRRILIMTFSRRAATELAARVERIVARTEAARYPEGALEWTGTFHAVGARILRDHAASIGLDPDFSIHDREDSADLMNLTRHGLGLSSTESRFPAKRTCLSIYSRCVNGETPLADVLRDHFPWCAQWEAELKRLFGAYSAAKQAQNVLDYDDLLLAWAKVMEDRSFAGHLGGLWDHVLIDEYQDTNRLQARILMALKPDGRGVTVVGDDAQSIYAFRAASVRNILDFPKSFDPPARTLTLDRNYRSTAPILAAANAVIGEATERFTKDLWTDRTAGDRPRLVSLADESDQARYVTDRVLEERERGTRLMDQAVLFRSSAHSAQLEVELVRRGVPFRKFGGLKFLDSAHVKDLLSLLRFARNPRDRVAGFRVLQLLPGVGPKTAERVLMRLDAAPRPQEALAGLAAPGQSGDAWPGFAALFDAAPPWPAILSRARAWYDPMLDRLHEDAEARRADLLQLERIAGGYGDLESFLTELTLDPPDATSAEAGVPHRDEDYLILSTIHSAKGQEWRSVHVLNVVDGCLPSDLGTGTTEEVEEERRLLYVAMTRAKDRLALCLPLRFHVTQQARMQGRHVFAMRSRFLPDHLLDRFEECAWSPKGPTSRAPAPAHRIDVRESLLGMWD